MLTQFSLNYFQLIKDARNLQSYGREKEIRIAIFADFATQQLSQLLKILLAKNNFNAVFYSSEYDNMEIEVFNENSGLYRFKPEIILLFRATQALYNKYCKSKVRANLANFLSKEFSEIWDVAQNRSLAKIIQSNYVLPYEREFGNFDQKVPESFHSIVSELNTRLAALSREYKNVFINDIESIASYVGRKTWCDEKLWTLAKLPCSLTNLPLLAQNTTDIILSLEGRCVKCIVLDLDNTLWGGIIGDDGLEGIRIGHFGEGESFHRFQQYLFELKNRGIILAVCSKNEYEAAIKPFRNHPEMVLKEEDISVFIANWSTKVDNIKLIQQTLNIGLDSIVFLDDNPFERNMIRQYLPEVIVPDLPEEPSDYIRTISELNLFETSYFTKEDRIRSNLYQEESERKVFQKNFTNVEEYLKSLDMKISLSRFDDFNLPRIVQLIGRSNQFNLTTYRYSISDCEAMMKNTSDYLPLFIKISDKFGDYGLISVIILKFFAEHAVIDSWLMSCRVLNRGIEQFIMNHSIKILKEKKIPILLGHYIPTKKNKMVEDLYSRFGFIRKNQEPNRIATWVMETTSFKPKETYLREI